MSKHKKEISSSDTVKYRSGFGWIETILFLAILAIIAIIAIPNLDTLTGLNKRLEDANIEAANVRAAAISFYINNNRYPSDSDELWNEPVSPSDYVSIPHAYYTFNVGNGRILDATVTHPEHIPDVPWIDIKWDGESNRWVKK